MGGAKRASATPQVYPIRQVATAIIDPAEFVRCGLREVLERGDRFRVVGEFDSFADLSDSSAEDADLFVFGPHAQAPAQSSGGPGGAIAIVLVDGGQPKDVVDAVRGGARAVLRFDAGAETLLSAAEAVIDGGAVLDQSLVSQLFGHLTRTDEPSVGAEAVDRGAPFEALSPREREVMRALARGYRNKEIAAMLGVSVGTVKTHLRHIFRKTRVGDRLGAVLLALHGTEPAPELLQREHRGAPVRSNGRRGTTPPGPAGGW